MNNNFNHLKKEQMITQADTLRTEIKLLEKELKLSIIKDDPFSQIHLRKELDIKKSILINIM